MGPDERFAYPSRALCSIFEVRNLVPQPRQDGRDQAPEIGEGSIEAAAKAAGKSTSVWLREAAIAYLNHPVQTNKSLPDPTLLAEVLGLRNLTINLLSAVAVDLPKETIQRIVTHADATKQGKAEEILRRLQGDPDPGTVAK